MATPETILGLGLMVAGAGFPSGVAMLKLWNNKTTNGGITPAQCRERHEMEEKLFNSKMQVIAQTVITVDTKVEAIRESVITLTELTHKVLDVVTHLDKS